MNFPTIFLELRFTSCNAEQPLQGMELKQQEHKKDEKHLGKLFRNNTKIKCFLTLDLKPRPEVKHSEAKEFQSPAVPG